MWLTRCLLYYVRRHHVPGKIDIGKHRVRPPVTCAKKKWAMTKMVQEQRNHDVLDRPFLTPEEDYRHEWDMGLYRKLWDEEKVARVEKNWFSNRSAAEYLDQLNVTKNWE